MHIVVSPGNKCWLVSLVDPEEDEYHGWCILKRFPEREDALQYAYRLTKLPVCIK